MAVTRMDIYLYNTLTKQKEQFTPIHKGEVSMYNCGPTVYHYAHLGNLRSYVFADTLSRMFRWNDYKVKQVINITDVGHLVSDGDSGEDKMQKGAIREGKTAQEISVFYTDAFFKDLDTLHIDRSHILFPKATEYIAEQIDMIKELERNGSTYITSDGVYFDTSTFKDYGALGKINLAGLEEGARIGVNTEKRNITDFALWKFSPQDGTKRDMEWESPWGVGFPGWHIECSAMSKALLGTTFDIHTGGIDHIPVHHNNEIAQSVCANHAPFVHYWLHNAFLTLSSGSKMAKSEDNFLRLESVREQGIEPIAYRYLLLTAHYSSPLEFSFDALKASEQALFRLARFAQDTTEEVSETDQTKKKEYLDGFTTHINDNLDTPKALALTWEMVKDTTLSIEDRKNLLKQFDTVFGLQLFTLQKEEVEVPSEIVELVEKRNKAREQKDFALSDSLRAQIESFGFEVLDQSDGTKVYKKTRP